MPSSGVAQTDDQPKDETLYTYCTEGQKVLAEALAECIHECSLGGLIRHLIEEHGHDELDSDTVDTILSGKLSEDEAKKLVEQEITVDDLDGAAEAAVADGGSATQPGSYSAKLTPAELAQSGRELAWDELRNIVEDPEDGGMWSGDLKIHPDRVPEDALTKRHKPATRVLTAMARSKATKYGDLLSGDELNELIDTYCLHLTSRFNEKRGKEYIRRTYRSNVEELLWTNPLPSKDIVYTTEERYHEAVETIASDNINPILLDDVPAIFDQSKWGAANQKQMSEKEWHADLGEALDAVTAAREITEDASDDALDEMDFDILHEAEDASHHFALLTKDFVNQYHDEVPQKDRDRIKRQHVSDETKSRVYL